MPRGSWRQPGLGRRGLTLVEMMVAVAVGAISVVMAAKVAQVVIRQNVRSREVTDLSARSRLLTHQIRTDVRSAGLGSTGAVGVDVGAQPWATMVGGNTSPGGFPALPAMMAADGIAGGVVAGVNVQGGSDALQLVVADGTVRGTLVGDVVQGANLFTFAPGAAMNCLTGYVLIVDSSSPQGAGRTQLLNVAQLPPWVGGFTSTGFMQFTAASGSQVYCARVSTYWVDEAGFLHRSDLQRNPGVITALPSSTGQSVFVDESAVGNDVMSPGVHDLQLAFRVSSAVYVAPPLGAPTAARWVFEGIGGNPDANMAQYANWFETRAVRLRLLIRTLRRGTLGAGARTLADIVATRAENGAGVAFSLPPPVNRDVRLDWVTMAEAAANLRFFDKGTVAGVSAEPY